MRFLGVLLIAGILPLAGCAAIQGMGVGGPDVEGLPEIYNVFFGFDSSDLDDAAQAVLAGAAENAMELDPVSIEIAGFSSPGPGESGANIAERRFDAVEAALAAHGVDRTLFERAELTPDPNLPELNAPRIEIRFELP